MEVALHNECCGVLCDLIRFLASPEAHLVNLSGASLKQVYHWLGSMHTR